MPVTSLPAPGEASRPSAAPEQDGGGLRERKKRERRNALIDATQRLVLEHGFDAVTVDAVCAEVGVSSRTFFNYFESKEDAVLGIEDRSVDPRTAEAFAAGGPTGRLLTDLQVLVADILRHADETPGRAQRAMAILQREPRLLTRHVAWAEHHRAELEALLDRRREVAPFAASTPVVTMVVLTLLRSAGLAWEHDGYRGSPADHLPDVVAQLASLVADG